MSSTLAPSCAPFTHARETNLRNFTVIGVDDCIHDVEGKEERHETLADRSAVAMPKGRAAFRLAVA